MEEKQINKIRNKKGEITTNNTEVYQVIRDYYNHSHTKKMDDLGEMPMDKCTIFQNGIKKETDMQTDQLPVMKLNQ